MAQQVIRGQKAIQEFLKKNPNAGYQIINDGTGQKGTVKAKRGLAGSLLSGVVDPFVNPGAAIGDLSLMLKSPDHSNYQAQFMDQGLFDQYRKNPLLEFGKDAAGIGSMVVPVGGLGLKGALLTGGLSGFSSHDGDTLTNTLTGAAGGGLLYGAGKGLSKLAGSREAGAIKPKGLAGSTYSSMPAAEKDYVFNLGKANDMRVTNSASPTDFIGQDAIVKHLENNVGPAKMLSQGEADAIGASRGLSGTMQPKGVNKVSGFLNKFADEQEHGAVAAGLGFKPSASDGGSKVINNIIKYKYDFTDPNKLAAGVRETLDSYNGVIKNAATKLSDEGHFVDVQNAINKINKKIADEPSKLAREPLIKARDQMIADVGAVKGKGFVSAKPVARLDKIYELKQTYGEMGKWNDLSPATEVQQAKAYETVYKTLNEELDSAFNKGGFKDFRNINKAVSENMQIEKVAKKAQLRDIPSKPVTLVDATAAMAGGAAFGVPGAVGAYAVKRAANSPIAQRGFVKGLRGAANMIDGKIPSMNIPGPLRTGAGLAGSLLSNPKVSGLVGAQLFPGFQGGGQQQLDPNMIMSGAYENPSVMEGQYASDPTSQQSPQMGGGLADAFSMRQQVAQHLMQQIDAKGNPMYSPKEALINADAFLEANGYDTSVFQPQKPAKPLTDAAKTKRYQSQSGMQALDDIENILSTDSTAMARGHLPGILQGSNARQLHNAINAAAEMFGRLQSGGAINKDEEIRFKQLLPGVTDDPETKAFKLNRLRQYFANYTGASDTQEEAPQGMGLAGSMGF